MRLRQALRRAASPAAAATGARSADRRTSDLGPRQGTYAFPGTALDKDRHERDDRRPPEVDRACSDRLRDHLIVNPSGESVDELTGYRDNHRVEVGRSLRHQPSPSRPVATASRISTEHFTWHSLSLLV